jgi:hypothetical protein
MPLRVRLLEEIFPRVVQRSGVLAMLILMLLTALMCGGRIVHGGFMADDWALQADAHFTGFAGTMDILLREAVRRPVGAFYFATVFTLIGSHIRLLLMLTATLHFLLSAALYSILRELRFSWLDSVVIAALALLFPDSDSTWLWASASSLSVALVCTLSGCVLNLRAVEDGAQHRIPLRIAGLALIAAGILTYELVAAIGLASGALYFMQTDSRRALREWSIDAVTLGVVLVVFTLRMIPILHGTDVHEVSSSAQMWEHTHVIFSQAAKLLTSSLLPFGAPRNSTVLGLLGALLALVLA